MKKMKNEGKRQNLSKVLLVRVLSLVTAVTLVIALSSCFISYNAAKANMEAQVNAAAVAYSDVLDKALLGYKLGIQGIAHDAQITNMNLSLADRKAKLQELADEYGFIDASVSDSQGYTYNDTFVAEREYFLRAMAGETYVSTTMVRKTDGSTVMFASTKINNGTGYNGIVYAAVDFSKFYDQVGSMAIGESGFAMAVDNAGTVLIYPDVKIVNNFTKFEELAAEDSNYEGLAIMTADMLAGSAESGVYEYDGDKYYVEFAKLAESDGWSFAAAAKVTEMLSSFYRALVICLLLFLVMVAISVFVTIRIKNSIAGPLDIITKRLVELAQGDAASPVPEITGCREIAELRDSTTTIVDTLDGLTKEVTNIAMGSVSGDLGIRGAADKFEGAYKELVDGINNMMDAIIRPLRKAADYMHRIGVGDVPEKLDSNYAGEFGEIAGSINFCIDAVNKLIEDTSYIAEAAVAGDFSRRGDLDKHSGDFRKIISGVNETLDVVADKAAWYQAILDCVPFPIQVTDNDLKLTFVNVNCAHQFIKDGIIKEHRIECYGMEAVDSRCALTSPENSGPKKMLENGISESEFMMGDSTFKQETSWLTNRKLEKLGLVEIALDQTAILKALSDAENMSKQQQAIGGYQNRAVEKLVVNLEKLASGDLSLDMEIEPSDKDTAEVAANFTKINENLARCTNAIRALVADANMMYQAAMAGDLDMRAETDKHGGEYANVVKGINATMDAIMEPVQASLKVIAAMAEGDLQQRMTGEYQGNYNMIKNAVNTTCDNMQGYVSEIARVLEGIGQGNLDQAVTAEYKGDFVQIKTSLNSILDSLNSIMGQINQLAEGVTQGSKNVSEGSQNLSNASTQQAATVQELSNTMSRVSQQIKQNTQDAQKASTVSTDVMHRAEQGNSQMKEMLISMADINESSANISKIIKVIDDIAFQTNILALNAAVEAARAGVHGKGFAVVADEVRSLAAKSAAAASETTTLIEGSVSKVDAGTKIADATAKALEAIVEGITETSGLCVEIAEVSEQQNEGINEVNRGIEEVSKVVQSNSATAEQSAALSGELYSQAQAMKQMVATFKLKGDSRTMLLPGK